MKKRILLRLVSLGITSSILFSCGGQLFAAEVNEPDVWGKAPSEREEKESSDEFEAYEEYEEDYEEFTDVISFEDYVDFDYDGDELAEKYIRSNMNPGRYAYNGSYDFAGGLSKCNATVYNYLLPHIKAIAAGTETSTKITIPDDVLYFSFDYDDMGIDPINSTTVERQTAIAESLEKAGFDSNEILTVLLGSCPYDLYWFDKVVGVSFTYSSSRGNTYNVFGFTFSFSVAKEYQADNIYSVNSSFGQAVTDAAANAKSIISANAGKDDYSKLLAYTDAIRDAVDYNYAAADSSYNGGYGNPWQMIWVFDGDDDTKVVCEGYSKAFQYLCDNTDFDDDDIYAISAYGVVSFASSKSEPHMWNIVHMDDGKNYVVDVTAMDTGDSDSFLKGAKENNGKGALLTNDDYYAYDGDLLSYYDNDVLTIAEADYVYTPASYTVTLNLIKNCDATLSKTSANAGDEITVTITPVEGYEFDYIEVNGAKDTDNKFTMPAEDVTVNVYCKKTDYTLTVNRATNGKVTANTATANVGDQITLTVTPDEGYALNTLTVKDANNKSIKVTNNKFTMPASSVTVSATFKKVDYKVQLGNLVKNCTPELSATGANFGDEITVTVNPVEGYELDYVEVNGQKIDGTKFSMPSKDVTVNVVCKKIDYTVALGNIIKNCDASLSVATANVGDEVTVTVNPVEGYEFDYIEVNGEKVTDTTFTMPAADVSVSVYCKKIDYTVALGNIIKNCDASLSVATANVGDDVTVNVTPVEGYEFDYIEVNGEKVTDTTFTMPAENVTVNVYCKKTDFAITCESAQNGIVNTNTDTANVGDDITITAAPADGYVLDSLTVKDAAGNLISVKDNVFKMPASSVTVSAVFKKIEYTVSLGNLIKNCNPKLSATSACEGDKITVTVNAVGGFELDYIEVNGQQIEGTEFTMPAGNVVVNVFCKKTDFAITCEAAQNGTVKTNTDTANVGDQITITAVPADGYVLDSITVKDAEGNVIAVKNNEFQMPASAVTVTAVFKKDITPGWMQDGEVWYYILDDGTKATGWLKVGAWYYFDEDGVMLTGWQKIEGIWYYLRASGSMVTGWLDYGNKKYYLKSSGAMAIGWEKINGEWYYFNASGAMTTGWQKVNGLWYYMDASGVMLTGWIVNNGHWYYLKDYGAMATGWVRSGGNWYYMNPATGAMTTGWITVGSYTYYLDEDGKMVTGIVKINGRRYRFADDGHCLNP